MNTSTRSSLSQINNNNIICDICQETSNFYLPFSRVGFSFFCDLDIIIYMFYSIYRPDIHLSFINIVLITFGFIILIGIINLFIFLIIEMPLIIFIKSHTNTNDEYQLLDNI